MSKQNAIKVRDNLENPTNIRNFSIIAHIDSGKCFTKGTPIMMPDGSFKYVEELKNGNFVMGDDMRAHSISNYHIGKGMTYMINQHDLGLTYGVNGQHILVLQLIMDHYVDYDKFDNRATLYYFQGSKLIVDIRENVNDFDKMLLNLKARYVQANTLLWQIIKKEHRIKYSTTGSWIQVSVEQYLSFPNCVKKMMKGVQIDLEKYHITNKIEYSLTDIEIKELDEDIYYGFEVPGNPRFLLSDGTIVHNSTLSDSLITGAGFIATDKAGKVCLTDTREDEKERGITIKSCSVSLHHQIKDNVLQRVSKNQKQMDLPF